MSCGDTGGMNHSTSSTGRRHSKHMGGGTHVDSHSVHNALPFFHTLTGRHGWEQPFRLVEVKNFEVLLKLRAYRVRSRRAVAGTPRPLFRCPPCVMSLSPRDVYHTSRGEHGRGVCAVSALRATSGDKELDPEACMATYAIRGGITSFYGISGKIFFSRKALNDIYNNN